MNEPVKLTITSSEPVRVPKICKNPRKGYPKGCGKSYTGFAFLHTAPIMALRKQYVEDNGEVWGLCDACVSAWAADRATNEYKPPVDTTPTLLARPTRVGDRGDAWEND